MIVDKMYGLSRNFIPGIIVDVPFTDNEGTVYKKGTVQSVMGNSVDIWMTIEKRLETREKDALKIVPNADYSAVLTPSRIRDGIKPNLLRHFPIDTEVVLIKMEDDYSPIPFGTRGKVKSIDDAVTIHVSWENGSGLGVAFGEDVIAKIEKPYDFNAGDVISLSSTNPNLHGYVVIYNLGEYAQVLRLADDEVIFIKTQGFKKIAKYPENLLIDLM